jgi:hypothetical protein
LVSEMCVIYYVFITSCDFVLDIFSVCVCDTVCRLCLCMQHQNEWLLKACVCVHVHM